MPQEEQKKSPQAKSRSLDEIANELIVSGDNLPTRHSKVDLSTPSKYGLTNYNPALTPEQTHKLENYFKAQDGMPMASMAMICKWHSCLYKDSCPLYKMQPKQTPEGEPCVMELALMLRGMEAYMEELQISETSVVDIAILKEILMWNISAKRALEEMANDPQIIRKTFVSVDKEGNAITSEQLHPAFNMLEKGTKLKKKLLESLIATRESKARDTNNKMQSMANLANAARDKLKERMQDLSMGRVVDVKPKDESSE